MLSAFISSLRTADLRRKILFTIGLVVLYRVGASLPSPGVNFQNVQKCIGEAQGSGSAQVYSLINLFSGGALLQLSVLAVGVMPYITASIIVQLLVVVIPRFEQLQKEGQSGQAKMTQYTRYLAVALAVLQGTSIVAMAASGNLLQGCTLNILQDQSIFSLVVIVLVMTAGAALVMWMGELVTERGIGNGMSLIISLGILSQLPTAVGMIIQQLNLDSQEPGQMTFASVLLLAFVFVVVTISTILVIQGNRRIPLQHARRMVGRKEVQGGSSFIPLKVNYAGVIPVIFASSLLMFPATLATFVGTGNWIGMAANWIATSGAYTAFYVGLIIFFTYFWTATQFHPDQIASDMKKNGAFIPGIRQGRPTQEFLESTMNRVTLLGAVFLAAIAILPQIVQRLLGVSQTISYFFGGTALLILVGVVLDTMKQVESHLLTKRYDGFMKKGRISGR